MHRSWIISLQRTLVPWSRIWSQTAWPVAWAFWRVRLPKRPLFGGPSVAWVWAERSPVPAAGTAFASPDALVPGEEPGSAATVAGPDRDASTGAFAVAVALSSPTAFRPAGSLPP